MRRVFLPSALAGVALLAAVAGLFAVRATHVAFRVTLDPSAVRPRSRCLLNPFRDRAPEGIAQGYLEEMRHRRPDVVRPFVRPALVDAYLQNEAVYPIQAWRIGDREDGPDGVRLTYWVRRGGGYPAGEEEVLFWLRNSGGSWRVSQYSAVY